MLKQNTRVVRLHDNGTTGADLGSVVSAHNGYAIVRWDNGKLSRHAYKHLISHQQLKSMFKYGPKLLKSNFG